MRFPWTKKPKEDQGKSWQEAEEHLQKIKRQQPEVDRIVRDLLRRQHQNNFRLAVEQTLRGKG